MNEYSLVVVEFVPVAFTNVKFWNSDWFKAPVPVAVSVRNWPKSPKVLNEYSLVVVELVPVAFAKVKFWNSDWFKAPVPVAVKELN